MATFLMLGKYSAEGLKGASSARTKTAVAALEKAGGKVNSMYALLGEHDLAFIVDFPGVTEAMKVSLELAKLTGIAFVTSPAVG
ncbi:MAG TPA: GYD domain-containing protein, partial [Candidatus Omnitrophota bacterium]|nr:GYD domain-containing protein [Candidatus Omnitrophota bacterium]